MEQAIVRCNGQDMDVELVNLSGGGAMIRGDLDLQLWDHVRLVVGEEGEIDCAVRWIKECSVGLEFAHETRIDCDKEERDEMLRAVIRKSFPHLVDIALEYPKRRADDDPTVDAQGAKRRQADRHPLVWNGVIYYSDTHDYAAEPVRLRNISITGALVQSGNALPEGETVYLDLRTAGRHAATVMWTCGDQAGLHFHELFDINTLSEARPEIAHATRAAEGIEDGDPWAEGWRRATVEEMARSLRQTR